MILNYLFDSDFSQRHDIEKQRKEIDQLKKRLQSQPISADESNNLLAENGRLKLYIAVIFRLLVSKGIVDRDELFELISEIDEEDGKVDESHSGDMMP